jgi:hypothetical protein
VGLSLDPSGMKMDEVKVEAGWMSLKPLEKRQTDEDRDGMRIERFWGETIESNLIPLWDMITPIIIQNPSLISLFPARHPS